MKLRSAYWMGLFLLPAPLFAGDVFAGFRFWEAAWSPGAIRQAEKQTTYVNRLNAIRGEDNLTIVTTDTKTATGTYAGPFVTYVTDDKLWSFSAVSMAGRSSPQSFATSTFLSDSNGINMGISQAGQSSPIRKDFDIIAARALSTYFKIFGGTKFQSYTYDESHVLNASISKLSSPAFQDRAYGSGSGYVAHGYSGPILGGAYGYPVSDTASISCSLGVFLARGRSRQDSAFLVAGVSGNAYRFESGHSETTVSLKGLTYEAALTTKASDSLFFQVSLRGQSSEMTVDFAPTGYLVSSSKGPTGVANSINLRPTPRTSLSDHFYGLTFSTIYRVTGI